MFSLIITNNTTRNTLVLILRVLLFLENERAYKTLTKLVVNIQFNYY